MTAGFCTHFSILPQEIASIALPGLLEYHEPKAPSLPAAMVTTLPLAEIRLETTALVLSVQPSTPPRDIVRMSWPSLTPRSSASTRTVGEFSDALVSEVTGHTIVCHRPFTAKDTISRDGSLVGDTANVEFVLWVRTDDTLLFSLQHMQYDANSVVQTTHCYVRAMPYVKHSY
jgi:hypothetical protein